MLIIKADRENPTPLFKEYKGKYVVITIYNKGSCNSFDDDAAVKKRSRARITSRDWLENNTAPVQSITRANEGYKISRKALLSGA